MKLSDGEKLIIIMLADLLKAHDVRGEIDPDFIKETLFFDAWAIKHRYHALFNDEQHTEEEANEVMNLMGMWDYLESSIGQLGDEQKEALQAKGYHTDRFIGFDGNNETSYYSIAETLTGPMNLFVHLKDRSMNSHMPMLDRYRQGYGPYRDALRQNHGQALSYDQIVTVLDAING